MNIRAPSANTLIQPRCTAERRKRSFLPPVSSTTMHTLSAGHWHGSIITYLKFLLKLFSITFSTFIWVRVSFTMVLHSLFIACNATHSHWRSLFEFGMFVYFIQLHIEHLNQVIFLSNQGNQASHARKRRIWAHSKMSVSWKKTCSNYSWCFTMHTHKQCNSCVFTRT